MHINLVSLFPEFFQTPLQAGLMGKAQESGILSFSLHNPRDLSTDKHHKVDDRPYGGGPGMVMLPQPMAATLESLGYAMKNAPNLQDNAETVPTGPATQQINCPSSTAATPAKKRRLIFLAPKGTPFTQQLAKELAQEDELTLICGRYEGLDARIEELFPIECISVGDFVLNGGESAALCLIEAVGRLLPGFMGHEESGTEESFSAGLLEYPHYTRPEIFNDIAVPEVLRSGDHKKIADWRMEQSLATTLANRPELLSEAPLTQTQCDYLAPMHQRKVGKNLYTALVHYPILDKYKNSVAVSLTNLDIHDIGRSSCTFGLGGYYILTPIEDQQRLLAEVLHHWRAGAGKKNNPHRDKALGLVSCFSYVADAIKNITEQTGQEPLVIGTAARVGAAEKLMGFQALRNELHSRPTLLLFGTGHGLAPEVNALCHAFLPPIRWHGGYNHLSVRSAVAIILDRILGDWY